MKRLLILSCSQDKSRCATPQNPLPAWDVYMGPVYLMLRGMRHRDELPDDLDVLILSAQYGLIEPWKRIIHYDLKMDQDRVHLVGGRARDELRDRCEFTQYHEVYIFGGKLYREALSPYDYWTARHTEVVAKQAAIGYQMQSLKAWIMGEDENEPLVEQCDRCERYVAVPLLQHIECCSSSP